MVNYFCRVTIPYASFSVTINRLQSVCEKMIVYEHSENDLNIHVHFLLLGFTKSTDSIKGWIKKDTGLAFKATDWSFKTKYKPHKGDKEYDVDENCITYMAKGHLDYKFNHGFTEGFIQEAKLRWVEYKNRARQSKLTSYIVKESAKASKLRQNEMIDEIVKRVQQAPENTPEVILSNIRQVVIIENKTIIGRYKVRDYYDTIRSIANPGTWLSSMMTLIKDKNFD